MKTYLIKPSAGATLVALALCFTPQVRAANTPTTRDAELAAAATRSAGASARDIIGQNIRNTAGETLGEIKDLAISPHTGRIVYAVVGSGGVLGVGEKTRAVPFSALTGPTVRNGGFTLDVTKRRWESAPILRDNELDLLNTEERGRNLFSYYEQDWNREVMMRSSTATGRSGQFTSASALIGKEIRNAGQTVAKIEDVIVDLSSRRAAALVDPDDSYVGSKEKFIVNFDQVMPSPDRKDVFATTLTRADFERAKPARDKWWDVTTDSPLVWSGYSYTHGVGYSAMAPSMSAETGMPRADRSDDHKVAVAEVRNALDNDPTLSDAARHVILREEGRKLVIRGTVNSKDIKEKIADRVEKLAKGWNVDNEIDVKSAAE